MMRKRLRLAVRIALVGAAAVALLVALRTPSLHREWAEDVRVLAAVDALGDGSMRLTDVRDWSYTAESVVSKAYFDATFDPRDIVDVWMYEQALDGRGMIAHTFIVFEFDDSYGAHRYLGLSVETRRESDEQYSLVGGVLRSFEVTHIWATEKDLVTRRVQYLNYPLTRYRLDIPSEYRARVFEKFVTETGELATTPRWYNTVLNNCTSSLIKYVNESEPEAIPFHYSYVLTGRMDEHLAALGYLDRNSSVSIDHAYLNTNGIR